MDIALLIIMIVTLARLAWAYPRFSDVIPNGRTVPHPCGGNDTWSGVGHQNPHGGGQLNAFGQDFKAANYQWGRDLCLKDSDGDGRTNGDELGDPLCVWRPGDLPSRSHHVTHPGICEPIHAPTCKDKNRFVTCGNRLSNSCTVLDDPDVRQLNLTFENFTVPGHVTNYYCMTFDLPADQDYHMVATEAIVDNGQLVHHMLLFGCESRINETISKPQRSRMGQLSCWTIIAGWALGLPVECFDKDIGFRIGKSGFRRVKLEIHYHNPDMSTTHTDASGLRLYYRPVQDGVHDLTTLMTGQRLLEIPPGKERVQHVGVCDARSTRLLLSEPVYIIKSFNHMHYKGASMKMELYRNGSMLEVLSHDAHFSFDSPKIHRLDPPIQIFPGDEIRTTCVYRSVTSDRWVYYGEGTEDEMCFGFLVVYPKQVVYRRPSCVSIGDTSFLEMRSGGSVRGCVFNQTELGSILHTVARLCDTGHHCRQECREFLSTLNAHACFVGEAFKVILVLLETKMAEVNFRGRVESCPGALRGARSTDGGASVQIVKSFMLLLFCLCCTLIHTKM